MSEQVLVQLFNKNLDEELVKHINALTTQKLDHDQYLSEFFFLQGLKTAKKILFDASEEIMKKQEEPNGF